MNFGTPDKLKICVQPGHIAVNVKWKNTIVHTKIKDFFLELKWFAEPAIVDFSLTSALIVYCSDSNSHRLGDNFDKLPKDDPSIVVIADRNVDTLSQYNKLQMSLYTHGLTLLPIGHAQEQPLLLSQLSHAHVAPSPASNFTPNNTQVTSDQHIQLLCNIPKLGKLKATKLLEVFGTVQKISFATVEDLVSVVGVSSAANVYRFFHDRVYK